MCTNRFLGLPHRPPDQAFTPFGLGFSPRGAIGDRRTRATRQSPRAPGPKSVRTAHARCTVRRFRAPPLAGSAAGCYHRGNRSASVARALRTVPNRSRSRRGNRRRYPSVLRPMHRAAEPLASWPAYPPLPPPVPPAQPSASCARCAFRTGSLRSWSRWPACPSPTRTPRPPARGVNFTLRRRGACRWCLDGRLLRVRRQWLR